MDVNRIRDLIMKRGPHRVMISAHEAAPCRRAREDHGIVPSVIFIRHDGWTLGAPEHLERAAYMQWPNEWRWFLRSPSTEIRSIENYGFRRSRVSKIGPLE